MEPLTLLILIASALLGGAQNAVAGGGSFYTFPALVWSGMGSRAANVTSTVALWPGSVASVFGYRHDLPRERSVVLSFAAVSAVGGAIGAVLLLKTPEITFDKLVPFLLLAATFIFAFGPRVSERLRMRHAHDGPVPPGKLAAFALVQFGVGVYAGYFGGGAGIVMLAVFAAFGMDDLQRMNGLKALLGSLANAVAIAFFAASGLVHWPIALAMAVASTGGGYGMARLSRRIPAAMLRRAVVAIGAVLTVAFFLKAY